MRYISFETFPNSDIPFKGYVIPVHIHQFPHKRYPPILSKFTILAGLFGAKVNCGERGEPPTFIDVLFLNPGISEISHVNKHRMATSRTDADKMGDLNAISTGRIHVLTVLKRWEIPDGSRWATWRLTIVLIQKSFWVMGTEKYLNHKCMATLTDTVLFYTTRVYDYRLSMYL
jgi:hypothetical protein